jgi:hypothetical protein
MKNKLFVRCNDSASLLGAAPSLFGTVCDELVLDGTTETSFDGCIAALEENGYEKSSERVLAGGKIVTLTKEDRTVNAIYKNVGGWVRVSLEDTTPVANTEPAPFKKITTTKVVLLGTEPKRLEGGRANGESVLIRLEDGRFIVIDGFEDACSLGGKIDNPSNPDCYDNIEWFLETIHELAKDYTDTPVVAGWFITHDHGDHDDMLRLDHKMLKEGKIEVENIYGNFHANRDCIREEVGIGNSAITSRMGPAAETFGANINRVHVGQKIYIANCEADVLYDWGFRSPTNGFGNPNDITVSVKFTFTDSETGEKNTLMSLGDAPSESIMTCIEMFGAEFMKSDMMTVPHHGYGSGNDALMCEVYKTVSPTYVLLPRGISHLGAGAEGFGNGLPSDKLLINNETIKTIKACYYSGVSGQKTVISLPSLEVDSETELK